MTTHTLGATAPLNDYIKPTTSFVQIELESGLLANSNEMKEVTVNNSEGTSLDFDNYDAFNPEQPAYNGETTFE